jgi:hypothetical protein
VKSSAKERESASAKHKKKARAQLCVLVGLLFVSVLLFERNKVVFTSRMKIHHFACGW